MDTHGIKLADEYIWILNKYKASAVKSGCFYFSKKSFTLHDNISASMGKNVMSG